MCAHRSGIWQDLVTSLCSKASDSEQLEGGDIPVAIQTEGEVISSSVLTAVVVNQAYQGLSCRLQMPWFCVGVQTSTKSGVKVIRCWRERCSWRLGETEPFGSIA